MRKKHKTSKPRRSRTTHKARTKHQAAPGQLSFLTEIFAVFQTPVK